jgi:hypothetical protein
LVLSETQPIGRELNRVGGTIERFLTRSKTGTGDQEIVWADGYVIEFDGLREDPLCYYKLEGR